MNNEKLAIHFTQALLGHDSVTYQEYASHVLMVYRYLEKKEYRFLIEMLLIELSNREDVTEETINGLDMINELIQKGNFR